MPELRKPSIDSFFEYFESINDQRLSRLTEQVVPLRSQLTLD
jgi:hypothetical protein